MGTARPAAAHSDANGKEQAQSEPSAGQVATFCETLKGFLHCSAMTLGFRSAGQEGCLRDYAETAEGRRRVDGVRVHHNLTLHYWVHVTPGNQ
jgi:hypothetical protein